jgi:hypothetical protein
MRPRQAIQMKQGAALGMLERRAFPPPELV